MAEYTPAGAAERKNSSVKLKFWKAGAETHSWLQSESLINSIALKYRLFQALQQLEPFECQPLVHGISRSWS